jgi:hypothetical protein
VALIACLGGCKPQPYSTPGTLYVDFTRPLESGGFLLTDTTVLRDSHAVGHKPIGFVVARDRPDRSLVASKVPVCHSLYGQQTLLLSPDGSAGLCFKDESLWVFETSDPKKARIVVSDFSVNANGTSFAWLDDARFVALVIDKSCPYSHLYDFFPTRLISFDRSGHRLATGACTFGVVAGQTRIAIVGEALNDWRFYIWQLIHDDVRYYNDGYDKFHLTWSVDDGETWHDGTPLAFDGNDRLLYAPPYGETEEIRSESGQIVFENASAIQWSR